MLVVCPPAPLWGAELNLLSLVEPLRERGVALRLGARADSPLAQAWVQRGWPLTEIDVGAHDGIRATDDPDRRAGARQLAAEARTVGRGFRDILRAARGAEVVMSFNLRTHLEVALAGRLARRPVVLDLVNIVRPGVGRRVLRTAARLATVTVANSAATAAVLGSGPRVEVVHPGVDLDRFAPGVRDAAVRAALGAGDDTLLVGIVGRIDPRKGVQVLVEAMARAQGAARDAHLVVVGDAGTGDPAFAAEVRAGAARRLGDRVTFTGKRSDIPAVIRCLDVLVNASVAEPFGLTLLEAQASGVPVVATDAGGPPEFVVDGRTGLLVPPFEPDALAAALDRLLADADLRGGLAAAALAAARPARGLVAQWDRLAAIYRSAAGAPPAPGAAPSSASARR